MNAHLAWYAARAAGIVSWLLLTAAVLWGLLLSTRLLRGRPTPRWLLDLHRFLGGLAVAFTAVHIGALVADNYVQFGLADLLVPFASSWRPGPVALGIVGFWLLLAVELTSLLMRWLPRRLWRGVHLSSYVLFWTATLHGITSGTDATNPAFVATVDVAVALVAGLSLVRSVYGRRSRSAAKAKARREAAATGEATGTATGEATAVFERVTTPEAVTRADPPSRTDRAAAIARAKALRARQPTPDQTSAADRSGTRTTPDDRRAAIARAKALRAQADRTSAADRTGTRTTPDDRRAAIARAKALRAQQPTPDRTSAADRTGRTGPGGRDGRAGPEGRDGRTAPDGRAAAIALAKAMRARAELGEAIGRPRR